MLHHLKNLWDEMPTCSNKLLHTWSVWGVPVFKDGYQGHEVGNLSHGDGIGAGSDAGREGSRCNEPDEQSCSPVWLQSQGPEAGSCMLPQGTSHRLCPPVHASWHQMITDFFIGSIEPRHACLQRLQFGTPLNVWTACLV